MTNQALKTILSTVGLDQQSADKVEITGDAGSRPAHALSHRPRPPLPAWPPWGWLSPIFGNSAPGGGRM